MSKVDVLLGLQWGDEGKGKAVDFLAPNYDIVARFQGGPNAGHTLEFKGKKHVLHQIPSGIFHPNITNIIGNGVVIDPIIFRKEINALQPFDINPIQTLVLSNKAQLIIPTHSLLDKGLEQEKGTNKIGSTLRGIGPAYQDKVGRYGLRVGDITEADFKAKYNKLTSQHVAMLQRLGVAVDFTAQESEFFESLEILKRFKIQSTEYLINNAILNGKSILAEGAQGTLLDVEFGSYPYVTSSNTTAAGACTGLGIAPNKIKNIFGIFKAYCTRVGSGPFPTELEDEQGNELRRLGNESGATTGRPRRCGWLDLPALNYACMLNGVTQLFMTKADVLSDMQRVKVCYDYEINGKTTKEFPFQYSRMHTAKCRSIGGWSLAGKFTFDSLPENLLRFISEIEHYTRVPVQMISTGPDREDTIIKPN
ncbi:MAG: adenylosuccinate synthase [Ekhidna sp.]|nr:adenylosuccinate synthase [Ekhidna sp.]